MNKHADSLALHGGPKAVTASGEDRWPALPVEAVKQKIGAMLDKNVITIANGTGVVGEFEEAFRARLGTRYALAMNNGTATEWNGTMSTPMTAKKKTSLNGNLNLAKPYPAMEATTRLTHTAVIPSRNVLSGNRPKLARSKTS